MATLSDLLQSLAATSLGVADRLEPSEDSAGGPDPQMLDAAAQTFRCLAVVLERAAAEQAGRAEIDLAAIARDLPLEEVRSRILGRELERAPAGELDLF